MEFQLFNCKKRKLTWSKEKVKKIKKLNNLSRSTITKPFCMKRKLLTKPKVTTASTIVME